MEDIENGLLQGHITYGSETEGLTRYHLQTTVKVKDEKNKIQVLSVGDPSDKPTKCVLLLGETGAGKTTAVNAIVNYIFGVKFDDNFRLQVKDQRFYADRRETESQTDFITVYTIYHREGMAHEYNFIIIDTPGLADTRGIQQQGTVMDQLEQFLTSNYDINDLHCIGLVAKANTNRDFTFQKDILQEIISLLGNNVPDITNLFATFAVEKPMVDQIVRNAGVAFKEMFEFDNGVLFAPHELSSSVHKRDRMMLSYRWENMIEQYGRFFDALADAPAVSVKLLREKKLLDISLKSLKTQVEDLSKLLTALELNNKMLIKYELQETKNREWKHEKRTQRKTRLGIEEGFHAHNCLECNQTCIFPCPPEKESGKSGIIGGVAGVLGGSAAGAAAAQATLNSVAAAARAATTSQGIATSIGGWITRALGGAVAGSEVGASGGVPGIIVGGIVGITIGVVTGTCCGKMLQSNSCPQPGRGDVCGEHGCLHSLSLHVREAERIVEYNEVQLIINDDIKELFDVAVSKKTDAMAKIASGKQKTQTYRKQVTQCALQVLYHVKKIQEFSLAFNPINAEELINKLISEVRLGQPDHIHHAIQILQILKKPLKKLSTCDIDHVYDNYDAILKLLESIPGEL